MKNILKYLRPFGLSIIMIIGLLFVQAMSELELPDYMSDIVNTGIQQGGIENPTPEVIRASEIEKMLLTMEEGEREKIRNSYNIISSDSEEDLENYIEEYPLLESEDLYILDEYDDDLDDIFMESIVILNTSQNSSMSMGDEIPESIGEDSEDALSENIETRISEIPESVIRQGAIAYVKQEYEHIGIDVDNIQSRYIIGTGAKMIGIALLAMVASVLVGLLAARVAAGLGKSLRSRVFGKVMNFSKAELDKFSASSLITRSTNDIQQVQNLMVFFLRIVFYAPLLAVGGIIKVLSTDASMGWIIAIAVGAILAVIGILFGLGIPKFKVLQNLVDKINMITRDSLTGMLVIRAFNNQKYEEDRFENANQDLTKTSLFVGRLMVIMMPLMMLVMNSVTVLIVWVGSQQVDAGAIQIGDMMAFIQYTMQIIMAFFMISMVSIMLPRATVSANRVGEVLDTEFSIKEPEEPKEFKEESIGTVEFENVYFRYPGAEEDVLRNISFKAEKGQTVAFIGSTGSGKSTLVNLIPRLYDVTAGSIRVNGVNIRNLGQKKLRDSIGYVPQKGILFSGSIESNIKYGSRNIGREEIEKSADIAQATEFISQKEDGFESRIAQGGANVSGGQKQRISIARALSKRPDIFIFDDSFSALDFKTDLRLRNALDRELKDSTLLIVAQRISTIINADKIVVLEEGEVVGVGKHEELLETCDVYRQIAESQLENGGAKSD